MASIIGLGTQSMTKTCGIFAGYKCKEGVSIVLRSVFNYVERLVKLING